MRHPFVPWHGPLSWLAVFALLLPLTACGPEDDDDTTIDPEDPWTAEQEGLDGAALSIWGLDARDVWVAGAVGRVDDPPDPDQEPMLLHRFNGVWERLETGESGQAWWVTGDPDGMIWVVGNGGLVLRYDREADSFTRVATDTTATFFGAWVAPNGVMYTAGGTVGSSTLGPVLLRVEGEVATEVDDLPAGVSVNETFFKAWGTSENDVWVISDMGTVLHFDGSTWSRQVLPDNPRLVTLHGSGPDDIVIVGGLTRATMFQWDGEEWADVSPSVGQPLNGIFVTADGGGFAAGFGNFCLERTNFIWAITDCSLQLSADWHAAWLDETGQPWLAGGDLISLDDGMIIRREAQ